MNTSFTAAFQGIFKSARYSPFERGEGAPRPDRELAA